MFTEIFSWCTSLGDKLSGESDYSELVDYYNAYFADTSVCGTIFGVGFAIALVVALLYYFVICNYVFKLAKRWVWFCVLALVFVISFFTTMPIIVGHDADDPEESTGIFFTAHQTEQEKWEATDDPQMRDNISAEAEQFRELFMPREEDSLIMEETLPYEMSLVNAVYAIIFFFLLSLLFKRFTKDGYAVPF